MSYPCNIAQRQLRRNHAGAGPREFWIRQERAPITVPEMCHDYAFSTFSTLLPLCRINNLHAINMMESSNPSLRHFPVAGSVVYRRAPAARSNQRQWGSGCYFCRRL